MQQIFLYAHLSGALVLGIFIVTALYNIFKNHTETFQKSAIQIGVGTGYQLITGSLLAIDIQTAQGLFQFCSKMGLYIGIVLFIETILLYRMQKNQDWIAPARIAFSSLTVGLIFTTATIFRIYGNI